MALQSLPPGTQIRLTEDNRLMLVDTDGQPLPDEVQDQFFEEHPPTTIEILQAEVEQLKNAH